MVLQGQVGRPSFSFLPREFFAEVLVRLVHKDGKYHGFDPKLTSTSVYLRSDTEGKTEKLRALLFLPAKGDAMSFPPAQFDESHDYSLSLSLTDISELRLYSVVSNHPRCDTGHAQVFAWS